MDVITFYALFSATCFTLVGLWWNVIPNRTEWMGDESLRRAVGGIYLSFLLPGVMGLFAQVGGTTTPAIWRASFVVVAVIGVVSTVSLLASSGGGGTLTVVSRVAAVVLYVVIAVVGVAPEIVEPLDLTPVQAEAILLIFLVVIGHAAVWQFMIDTTPAATPGKHEDART